MVSIACKLISADPELNDKESMINFSKKYIDLSQSIEYLSITKRISTLIVKNIFIRLTKRFNVNASKNLDWYAPCYHPRNIDNY